jgi:hypothetical protein
MAGEVLRTTFEVRLDWSGSAHWGDAVQDCRRCGTGTRSRDGNGPIHQSCAEQELADQVTAERFGSPAGRDRLIDERYPRGGAR